MHYSITLSVHKNYLGFAYNYTPFKITEELLPKCSGLSTTQEITVLTLSTLLKNISGSCGP